MCLLGKQIESTFMCFSVTSWKSSSGPSKPPETDESEGHTWSHGKFPGRLIGDYKMAIGVNMSVNGCLSPCTSPVI